MGPGVLSLGSLRRGVRGLLLSWGKGSIPWVRGGGATPAPRTRTGEGRGEHLLLQPGSPLLLLKETSLSPAMLCCACINLCMGEGEGEEELRRRAGNCHSWKISE